MIVARLQRFQGVVGAEYAAATGAKHVPGQIEQPEPRGMEEAGDHPFFVEPGPLGKIQHIDSVELVILALVDQPRDSIGHRRIGGLLQHGNLGLDVAHAETLNGIGSAYAQCHQRGVTANIGKWSGWVVTTPTGTTGCLSSSSTRNAPINLASASVASTSAKCAPMQTRGPTPNGR